jgi:sensor histidine kinase YesM
MDKTEKRICWYSSLLIGLLMSSPKVLALRENGIIAHYWHFNLAELVFQVAANTGFCYLLFFISLTNQKKLPKGRFRYYLFNIVVMIVSCIASGILQLWFFRNAQLPAIYWLGYISRFFLSFIFTAIIIQLVFLIRESKQKDAENNQLKTAYLEAELELLKEQLNPHFLFNSLSSLSGLVRENPARAQQFINHLSKIFRYALAPLGAQLVTVGDELTMIKSYEQLLVMRFEKAFELEIAVAEQYLDRKIPHLTLQPLLENAAKHNSASPAKPSKVKIFIEDNNIVVSNNLQEITEPGNSTGIGLTNLNSRFRILMNEEIEIVKTIDHFIVKLPLKA